MPASNPVLIIGATGDLGAGVARALHAHDVPLLLHGGSNERALADLTDEVDASAAWTIDLRTHEGIDQLQEALDRYDSLDGVVFTAGVNPTAETTAEISDDDWDEVYRVNHWAAWKAIQRTLPLLRADNGGSLVLVSSVFGIRTPARRAAYGASKHALLGLVQAVAQEEAGVVRANAVLPGPMWSENVRRIFQEHAEKVGASIDEYVASRAAGIPRRGFVTVEECANVCRFLLSTDSSGINGQSIIVDGGEY
ncbi:SDR family NAD(P)-dependent oxidoreductase [Nocardioides speluncae]|uniref:SDR family NAD(P)-dependent oxidoreductase n=1 Tax=Nocardioides speluncae TaxID=2670337 RepID=UPI00137A25A4|nr:SDR family oxidoreductase [Nocardioides speluncae]